MVQMTMEERIDAIELTAYHDQIASENTWILLTATIVFLMQYGFALLESGMCRRNNTTATYTKNMLDATIGTMVAVLIGYRIAYGITPVNCSITTDEDIRQSTKVCSGFFHHLVFQATA